MPLLEEVAHSDGWWQKNVGAVPFSPFSKSVGAIIGRPLPISIPSVGFADSSLNGALRNASRQGRGGAVTEWWQKITSMCRPFPPHCSLRRPMGAPAYLPVLRYKKNRTKGANGRPQNIYYIAKGDQWPPFLDNVFFFSTSPCPYSVHLRQAQPFP